MFCYQCEQTAKGTGCTSIGACGKDAEVAALQDLVICTLKGISVYGHRARELGSKCKKLDLYLMEGLFATVTNVNFDQERLKNFIYKAPQMRDRAKQMYHEACEKAGKTPETFGKPAEFQLESDLVAQAANCSIDKRKEQKGEDIVGLQELLLYGLKGVAAYADHAQILGEESEIVTAFFYDALNFLTKQNPSVDELLTYCLKCGEVNLKVMEILDKAHTDTYGHPVPTKVRVTPVKGKAILVSGHDLKDLEELLKQTEGTGVNVYTHGEMLPAHGYPKLKQYKHLVGNYGGAWQDQQKEFDEFPGSILMTTNCIIKPREDYKNRIFTKGCVAWPGVKHLESYDFSELIKSAQNQAGFTEDTEPQEIMVGFGRNAVMSVAGTVIDAVKSGAIKHFFLIGGCDGAKPGRNYYSDLADAVPKDCVILTLACGKYRFNKKDFGDIGGIPRLLDIGQCNDAYSAIQIAVALANAFETDVNSLPLSMILSWFEQKAVCILLTLLHLGIKNIRLGPTLPAFVTPTVLNVLVEKFAIKPIGTPEGDLNAILGQTANI
ncbi:MAG: hydroxylamine reductase [Vampirovibrionia bacterium]